MTAVSDCALCATDGGRLIWRNDAIRVVAVDDADLPGYTRIIWQQHETEITDLSSRDQHELMRSVFVVEGVQRAILQADKINLASLGNMTPHLHWHIIPRWKSDPWFPDSIWAQRREGPDALAWPKQRKAIKALLPEYEAAVCAALEQL